MRTCLADRERVEVRLAAQRREQGPQVVAVADDALLGEWHVDNQALELVCRDEQREPAAPGASPEQLVGPQVGERREERVGIRLAHTLGDETLAARP